MENISFKVPEPSEYSKVLEAFEDYFTERKYKLYTRTPILIFRQSKKLGLICRIAKKMC